MFKFFSTEKFWANYMVFAAICFLIGVFLSGILSNARHDISEVAKIDPRMFVGVLLLPLLLSPIFLILALIEKYKPKIGKKSRLHHKV